MNSPNVKSNYNFPVIGIVRSCFQEKFGIPRQSGLAPAAQAWLEMLPPYNTPEAFVGLEQCSHLWLQFVFHLSLREQWKPRVRPPRLGGNKSLGVFATRSPVRPGALGLSVVKLEKMELNGDGLRLLVSGIDMVEGTPLLDIKPYVPYADCVPDAHNLVAPQQPPQLSISFSPEAEAKIHQRNTSDRLRALIVQVLQQDPRPKYQSTDTNRTYGMKLQDFDLKWRYLVDDGEEKILVLDLENITL